ncbi:aminotransferase class IV [Waterburya agarophytonicola K14]|uniref:Aminotransferase class IV n=1 Tax=Waterburya agarophytonicola KI4 TaxID=2874699 RepID=A0A964BRG8_9CYAN|nr:aminotransferase class IV [Waterburya agarophytonicola]MCC0178353.1 aminotransferase class IV [Waterburya agarophytonicola KI4]
MYWYDGKLIDSKQILLDADAPELCYGASIFTTMRVYQKSLDCHLTYWQAHCDRLNNSLKAFNWLQPDWEKLKQGALHLSSHFTILRMAIFPDGKEWITGRNLPEDLKQRQSVGITAWVATDSLYKRELAQHKTGNYLGSYLARQAALKLNAQEAILIDRHGNWLETSTGNLWGWQDGCWYTPNLDSGILSGIQRTHLLNFLRNNNIPVKENIWTQDFVSTLEAISYSNCVVETIPIRKVLYLDNWIDYPINCLETNIKGLR